MSGGAGGCAQGLVHCRWLYTCLCIACGSQSSTSHACCRTARASLHLLKRSFGLRCEVGRFLGLWACMLFAFLHCIPGMWSQHPGTKRKKAWMKDATCRSSTRSLQKAKRIFHGPWFHKFWSWATNFSIVAPFLGPESGPCFGATKHYSILAASVLLPPQADSSTRDTVAISPKIGWFFALFCSQITILRVKKWWNTWFAKSPWLLDQKLMLGTMFWCRSRFTCLFGFKDAGCGNVWRAPAQCFQLHSCLESLHCLERGGTLVEGLEAVIATVVPVVICMML